MRARPARAWLHAQTLAGRLARTLILWVGGVWLACVLGVVWYVDGEINYNFDSELIEVSHRLFGIALEHLDAAGPTPDGAPRAMPAPQDFADAEVPYRLVGSDTRELAHSSSARDGQFDVPLATGFADQGEWRIYTLRHPTRPVYLQVADPLHERREAVNRTLVGLIVPLVAVLPLLAWLLRRIARRQLRVLEALAREIGLRDGALLTPIALPGLPHELRSVEEHVNHLLQRLSLALDVERALAANAAHELRTPLAAARLRLQTALDHGLARTDVQAALDALGTLAQRTEKLLQLSRAESSAPLAREAVPLEPLATQVAQEFWADEALVDRLDLVVAPDAAHAVAGDVDALGIALRNLVENALRYSAGSAVELRVGPGPVLAVRDAGPGVPAHALDGLRQRHVRASADRAGYGLGLSIVASIAERHQARLVLASPPPGQARGFEARLELQPG